MIGLIVFGVYVLIMVVSMRYIYRWRVEVYERKFTRYYRDNLMMDSAWWSFWMSFVWPLFWAWRVLRPWIVSGSTS